MNTCIACGGVLGRDCFNEHDCIQISQNNALHDVVIDEGKLSNFANQYADKWAETDDEKHRIANAVIQGARYIRNEHNI